MLRNVIGKRPDVTVLDLNKKLCPDGGYTNKIDGVKMRIDGVHPTPEAVKWLTPWLTDALSASRDRRNGAIYSRSCARLSVWASVAEPAAAQAQ